MKIKRKSDIIVLYRNELETKLMQLSIHGFEDEFIREIRKQYGKFMRANKYGKSIKDIIQRRINLND